MCDLLQFEMVKGHQEAYKIGCGMREGYWYNDGDNMLWKIQMKGTVVITGMIKQGEEPMIRYNIRGKLLNHNMAENSVTREWHKSHNDVIHNKMVHGT